MKIYEASPEEREKLISKEDASGVRFHLMRTSFWIAVIGFIIMFIAYVYRDMLTENGFDFRQIQGYSIAAVFAGWMLFLFLCRSLGISTRKLTYPKLRSILRNEIDLPFDMDLSFRKKVANSLIKADDRWSLFSTIYKANPERKIAMTISGPGGVFILNPVTSDPRDKKFADPGKPLLAGKTAMELRIKHTVVPILLFRRHKKYYTARSEDMHLFLFQELSAHILSRPETIGEEELAQINASLKELAGIRE